MDQKERSKVPVLQAQQKVFRHSQTKWPSRANRGYGRRPEPGLHGNVPVRRSLGSCQDGSPLSPVCDMPTGGKVRSPHGGARQKAQSVDRFQAALRRDMLQDVGQGSVSFHGHGSARFVPAGMASPKKFGAKPLRTFKRAAFWTGVAPWVFVTGGLSAFVGPAKKAFWRNTGRRFVHAAEIHPPTYASFRRAPTGASSRCSAARRLQDTEFTAYRVGHTVLLQAARSAGRQGAGRGGGRMSGGRRPHPDPARRYGGMADCVKCESTSAPVLQPDPA